MTSVLACVQHGMEILKKGGFYGVEIELCFDSLQGSGPGKGGPISPLGQKAAFVYHNMRRLMRNKQKRALGYPANPRKHGHY